MKRSNFSQLAFTLTLAAICAFGLSLTLSQPAQAVQPPCPAIACSASATVSYTPCDYTAPHGCIYRCFTGTDTMGPFTVSCYGNCYSVPL